MTAQTIQQIADKLRECIVLLEGGVPEVSPTEEIRAAKKPGRGKIIFPGICADAEVLGVNRISLYRALKGQWHLPKLLARYRALKKNKLSPVSKP